MTRGHTSVRLLLTALIIPTVLAVGACGGSSDDAASPTSTASGDGASGPSTTAGESGGGEATGDYCERIVALEGNDQVDNAEALANYRNALEVAPDEVRPDLEVVIEYFEAIDPAAADPAAAQKVAEISQQYADASVRLVRYVNENC